MDVDARITMHASITDWHVNQHKSFNFLSKKHDTIHVIREEFIGDHRLSSSLRQEVINGPRLSGASASIHQYYLGPRVQLVGSKAALASALKPCIKPNSLPFPGVSDFLWINQSIGLFRTLGQTGCSGIPHSGPFWSTHSLEEPDWIRGHPGIRCVNLVHVLMR